MIAGLPMFVAPWSPEFTPEQPQLTSAVVPVELRGVPYLLFNKKSLSRIATAVGKPVSLAPETERKENFEVAKVWVRVNLLAELRTRIVTGFSNGREVEVTVTYPWLPSKCGHCGKFGHESRLCNHQSFKVAATAQRDKRSKSRGPKTQPQQRPGRSRSRSRITRTPRAIPAEEVSDRLDMGNQKKQEQEEVASSVAIKESESGPHISTEPLAEEVKPPPQKETRREKEVKSSQLISRDWDSRSPAVIVTHENVDAPVGPALQSRAENDAPFFLISNRKSGRKCFNLADKRQSLWEELSVMNATTPVSRSPWAVIGDFNQIMRSNQHSNHLELEVDISGMEDFNLAIQDCEVFEAQAKGLPFSWWNNQESNPISKKIDHALINQHWAHSFPEGYAEFLEPQQSDHAPCLFRLPALIRRPPKPFKFYHHIIGHPQYEETVRDSWNCGLIQGSAQFKVVRAFKLMKPALKRLNKRYYSGISERVKEQAHKVEELQRLLLTSPTKDLARLEHRERSKWRTLVTAEEKFFRQRSRVQWLHLGDRNTSFFHKSVVQRANRNHIHFLRDHEDRLLGSTDEIKTHSAEFFKGILGNTVLASSSITVDQLQSLLPFRCSDAQVSVLQKVVSDEEIKATVFALPLNKSPGPDGYSVEFLRASWEVVGGDILAAVHEFFRNGRLLKDIVNTAITLIPKMPEASKLGDYRPISCCNLLYKIISKIIANRMKPILLDCISPNQAAFLKGRSLGENVLLASELIRNYQKLNCPKSSMLKVDIRKSFDTVCWDFVLKLLEAQNFPPLFRCWISECISSPRFSVAINGELAGFFAGKKGLRQGDSISPYLFIMVMEVLSKLLDKAQLAGDFELHPKCMDLRITHHLFADDLLVFTDGSSRSIAGVASVMQEFKEVSGLEMNPDKSEIFFGGYNDDETVAISGASGIKLGTFPTRYLWLPLNPSRITLATLQPFVERITAKLHSWTVKLLSFAGKVRMIASVIYGMVNFWSSVFALPKSFYRKVDSLCAAFLWKNKTSNAVGARVSWKDVCRPKEEGGIEIRLLEDFERVFRLKLLWNFFANSGSLWVAWLKRNIFHRRGYWLTSDSNCFSGSVRSMIQLKESLSEFMRCEIRNGEKASFWFDVWCDLGPLKVFLGDQQDLLKWRLHILLTSTTPPSASLDEDVYLWRKASGNFGTIFSSKATWEFIRQHSPTQSWHKALWFKENIPRCTFISWLALLRRLPTRDRLRRWGMNVSPDCVLCSAHLETHHHLFFECSFSASLWQRFASAIWSKPPSDLHSAAAWINLQRSGNASQEQVVAKLLFQAIIYLLWKERNARIFSGTSLSSAVLSRDLDHLIRDRLLSFPATTISHRSLLEFCFSTFRPP
ncbi:unnamed protein product [Microthlaspi erraticum]|uniref:Reverse transcriptase domain-containing protein n=1 Tax=Microthlaspi erraticum TaxID=1685480 RepID=A0A6D2JR89_9BRAS|nr:unnamed protein product [Microthlaspi erraticum]